MTQNIFQESGWLSAAGIPALIGQAAASSAYRSVPIPVAGTFKNWKAIARSAVAAGTSRTIHFQKNGSTAMSTAAFTDSVTDGSNLSDTVTVAAGDLVNYTQTRVGAPAGQTIDMVLAWEPDDGETQIYSWHSSSLPQATSGVAYIGALGDNFSDTSDAAVATLIAVAGTITGHIVQHNTAPGSGKSITYALVLNGTVQDGAGATVDTRITIADSNTQGSATFTLPVAAGDRLSVQHFVVAGTVPGIVSNGTIAFVPTTAGQTHYGFTTPTLAGGAYSEFWYPHAPSVQRSATEAARTMPGAAVQTLRLTGMSVALNSGAGVNRRFTLFKNGAATALTVLIDDPSYVAETVVSVAGTVTIGPDDTWTVQEICGSGVTGGGAARVALVGASVVPIIGSFVRGVNTSVTASRGRIFR